MLVFLTEVAKRHYYPQLKHSVCILFTQYTPYIVVTNKLANSKPQFFAPLPNPNSPVATNLIDDAI